MALKKSKSIIALAISSLLLLAACDDDGRSSPVTPSDSVESSSSADSLNSSSSDSEGSSSSVALANSSSSAVKESSSSIALEKSSSSLMSSSSVISSSSGESSSSIGHVFESSFNPDIIYGTMTDSRDKKVYKTIKIGDQTWMAENLNYFDKTLNDRSWCFGASDSTTTANCAVAGRLYTWSAAIDSAKLYNDKSIDCGHRKTCTLPDTVYGVCPPGWHLPTRAEWDALITEVGGLSNSGIVLKSQTGWFDNYDGTDDVGFTALPVGIRNYDGDAFDHDAFEAHFWSATEYSSYGAYYMDLDNNCYDASLRTGNKNYGFSVRCLKDDP